MTKIILNGCNGRMGQVISAMAAEDPELEIAAGIDMFDEGKNPYPVFTEIDKCDVTADVVIDFSSPKAFDALMDYCVQKELPVVVCTTGLDEKQVAVLKSANMSLGINLLIKLLKEAAAVLAPAGFDVEIVEKHHNRKKDAPSGTAIALADSINEALGGEHDYIYDRSQRYEERSPREIGISAVRGGTIVGDHEVIFAGTDEVIEFKHTAYSRAIFAKGALQAARFLAGKAPGYYGMEDVIG